MTIARHKPARPDIEQQPDREDGNTTIWLRKKLEAEHHLLQPLLHGRPMQCHTGA
ncbi:hypothetical protein P245_14090 [Comamonas thiooxydans]|uniref:Uncharacterized protein n=1 Tax=Comamonas thiooxydans TaxID=363952 RepID=A0A0E3BF18_9BURK|nr:hypothetical protein P245_14090 [Comamonas thiooxydans]